MAIAYEGNTDLAFDTEALLKCGRDYSNIASIMRRLSSELDACLTDLAQTGWTTEAGKAFQKMAEISWQEEIEKYARLLDQLNRILQESAGLYDDLVQNSVEKVNF